jgi:predicted secreted protein
MVAISSRATAVTWNRGVDELDVTALNTNWRDYIPGLQNWGLDIRGIYDDTATTGVDAVFDGITGLYIVETCFGPSGSDSGLPRYSGSVLVTNFNTEATVDGPVTFTATAIGVGAYTRGTF